MDSFIDRYKKALIASAIFGVLLLVMTVFMISFKVSLLSWGWFGAVNSNAGTAIDGYDTVSYMEQGKAMLGNADITTQWKGVSWHFSSEDNKTLFVSNPEKYAPQYGGFCSLAVSKGFTAISQPESFQVVDQKLYLFSDDGIKKEWNSEGAEKSQRLADTGWATRSL